MAEEGMDLPPAHGDRVVAEQLGDGRGRPAAGRLRAVLVARFGGWHGGSMRIKETITYLQMTAADQLRPGRLAPAPVEIVKLDWAAAAVLRRTYARIAAPLNWQSRRTWSDAQWTRLLARPEVHAWIARVGDEVAGMVEVEAQPGGDVEITVFGLVPEFVGRGFGAHLLTVGTRLAWQVAPLDSVGVRRVWLHTSSRDHPHAKPNYEGRGFRVFRTERREREIST
jgi:ribosomal protein S18 acetylase RimI-like enzyme